MVFRKLCQTINGSTITFSTLQQAAGALSFIRCMPGSLAITALIRRTPVDVRWPLDILLRLKRMWLRQLRMACAARPCHI